eukprot:PhF_6_TR6152/c0_g1_i2/m.9145
MVHPGWFRAISATLLTACKQHQHQQRNSPRLVWRTTTPTNTSCVTWVQHPERNVALHFKDPSWLIADSGNIVYQALKSGCPASSVYHDGLHLKTSWNTWLNQHFLHTTFGIKFDVSSELPTCEDKFMSKASFECRDYDEVYEASQ